MSSLETITYPKTQDQGSFSSHLCFTFLLTEEYLLYCIAHTVLTTVTVVLLLDISRKINYEMFFIFIILSLFVNIYIQQKTYNGDIK